MADTHPMPPIIYGTAWKKLRTTDLVLKAFQAGFRGVDTACQPKHYEEAFVGKALNQLRQQGLKREEYYLQTKYTPVSGHAPTRIPYDPEASITEQVSQSFARSQSNLETDYVDAYILHSPLESYDLTLEAWRAMENIYQHGHALRLGISNCYDLAYLKELYAASVVKPQILQNRFYSGSAYDVEMRQWCKDNQITYQCFWTLTANPNILESETVVRIAIRHKKTAPEILFAYLGQQGIVPLTGTSDIEHMQEDLTSFDIPLSPLEVAAMHTLFEA